MKTVTKRLSHSSYVRVVFSTLAISVVSFIEHRVSDEPGLALVYAIDCSPRHECRRIGPSPHHAQLEQVCTRACRAAKSTKKQINGWSCVRNGQRCVRKGQQCERKAVVGEIYKSHQSLAQRRQGKQSPRHRSTSSHALQQCLHHSRRLLYECLTGYRDLLRGRPDRALRSYA
jgi:hypothetical protein